MKYLISQEYISLVKAVNLFTTTYMTAYLKP